MDTLALIPDPWTAQNRFENIFRRPICIIDRGGILTQMIEGRVDAFSSSESEWHQLRPKVFRRLQTGRRPARQPTSLSVSNITAGQPALEKVDQQRTPRGSITLPVIGGYSHSTKIQEFFVRYFAKFAANTIWFKHTAELRIDPSMLKAIVLR